MARLLGLTSYDLKTYLALVEGGPSTAKDLAQRAGVPFSKIYSVLNKLSKMGFVDVDNSRRPEVFHAKSPMDVFSSIMRGLESYINSIRPLIDSLQLMYEATHVGKMSAHGEVMYVARGLDNARELMLRVATEDNLDVAMPYRDALDYRMLSRIEDVSLNHEVRLLISSDMVDIAKELPPRISVRIKGKMFGGGVIGGGGVVLVLKHGEEYLSLYSRQDYIVDVARIYFNHLWREAEAYVRN